jgi:hypothetical protein
MKFTTTPDGTLIFKIDQGVKNYDQRDNKFKFTHPKTKVEMVNGLTMCNVTAYCEAAEINGFIFPKGSFEQPEDNFCSFLFNSNEVMAYYKQKMPAMYDAFERGDKDAYTPNEIHAVLAYAFNKWMGCSDTKPIATFRDNALILDILSEIIDDRAVVMSGTFPYKYNNGTLGTIGHINVLVGLEYSKDTLDKNRINIKGLNSVSSLKKIKPTNFIFDDPYGNLYKNFESGTGNDVKIPYTDFIKYYKPLNDVNIKYAHTFSKAAATI